MKKLLPILLTLLLTACAKQSAIESPSTDNIYVNVEVVTESGPVYAPWIQATRQ